MAAEGVPLVIVKLGGAALTNKLRYRDAYEDRITQLTATIGSCAHAATSSKPNIIVVHGAGSYGHFEAKQAALNSRDPADFPKKSLLGLACTCTSLALLNAKVLDGLTKVHVPAVSVPVFPRAVYSGAALELLDRGFMPVLHGDVILDDALVMRVVSGDEIVQVLAREALSSGRYTSVRVVFVTGAPGIFTAAPAVDPAARLLARIYMRNSKLGAGERVEWEGDTTMAHDIRGAFASNPHVRGVVERVCLSPTSTTKGQGAAASASVGGADTTGGISGKLEACLKLASLDIGDLPLDVGVDVHVVGADLEREELCRLLDGTTPRTALLSILGTHIFVP